jgi:hypothetical protein
MARRSKKRKRSPLLILAIALIVAGFLSRRLIAPPVASYLKSLHRVAPSDLIG